MTRESKITAAWLIGFGLLPFALLHLVHQLDRPGSELDAYRIDSVRFVVSDSARPPVDADWRTMPVGTHVPAMVSRDRFNSAWVAIDPPFPTDGPDALALYLPVPLANVAVYVGETFVGDGGAMKRPLPYYVRPLYFRLPFAADSRETVYVRIAREKDYLQPMPIYVGPADVLAERHASARMFRLWVPAVVATVMLVMAAAFGLLYLLGRRQHAYFGIYALITALYALHTIHSIIDRPPIEHWSWMMLIYLLLWWAILFPALANRAFRLGMDRLERATLVGGAVLTVPMPLLLAAFRIDALYGYYAIVWVPYVLLCTLLSVVLFAIASWRHLSFESVGMYAGGALAVVFGVRDHLFDFTDWVPGTTFYIQYVGTAQVLFVGYIVARRYVKSANQLAVLNRELEDRVRDKAREIERGYEARRELEREQTLSRERERLMRDMHDGLGGQLVQALALSDKERSPAELRDSLERALMDLRLIVDSIAPEQSDVVALLASFRHRSKSVWKKSGVTLHWNVGDAPSIELGPERSLNVLRIVQEATTNAIRHGEAQNIYLTVHHTGNEAVIEIRDDGGGFDTAAPASGFGLANMRRRAEAADTSLDVTSAPEGTCVRLVIAMG